MLCPKCQTTMREREKGEVIIDICPECRGVWLDAGELEKLSDREQRYYDDDDDRTQREHERPHGQHRPYKKKGFLSNLMEGFGGDD